MTTTPEPRALDDGDTNPDELAGEPVTGDVDLSHLTVEPDEEGDQ